MKDYKIYNMVYKRTQCKYCGEEISFIDTVHLSKCSYMKPKVLSVEDVYWNTLAISEREKIRQVYNSDDVLYNQYGDVAKYAYSIKGRY
jgi:hypothetical protein